MTHVTGARRLSVGLAAAVAVGSMTVGPATAGPTAEPSADPVPGLVGGLLGQGGQQQGGSAYRHRGDYGHTGARDGVLRDGCHGYRYRYALTPPTHDWTLETFLVDRTGDSIASGTYFSDSDPARNRPVFRFCRYSTHPGRFHIRAKMHWYDGSTDHLVWLPRSHFRLRRP